MKAWAGLAALLCCSPLYAEISVPGTVTSADGKTVYDIIDAGGAQQDESGDHTTIVARDVASGTQQVLVAPQPADDPKQNLTDFSGLVLSPDNKTLYFHAEGWATSSAIHAVDLTTHQQRFVTDGTLLCTIASGDYKSDLLVQQHRYFVGVGGAYDYYYVYKPSGKEVGLAAGDNATDEDLKSLCQSLE